MLPAAHHVTAIRRITPEPLNVAPQLVGLPLATPGRRAAALLLDGIVVAMLSDVSGFWLLAGLVLVVLQLRSPRGGSKRRTVYGWIAVAVIALLAFNALRGPWSPRSPPADELAELAATAPAASAAGSAASAAVGPVQTDAERIAELEAQLKEARRARPLSWREQFDRVIDDIGRSLGWGIVYFSLLPAWWGGQTVGKKLLRLRVVELTGAPMTVMRCLRRYGGYAAGMATGGMGFLQMLWDPNRQAIQDRTAHTAVIDLRVAALPVVPVVPVVPLAPEPPPAEPAPPQPPGPGAT